LQFEAKGPPEALRDAVDLLLSGRRVAIREDDFRRRHYDDWDLTEVRSVGDARSVCEKLAERYEFARHQQKMTPSLTKLRTKLRAIESHAGQLQRKIKGLSQIERYAIHVVDDYRDTTQTNTLLSHYKILEGADFLPAVELPGPVDADPLAEKLESLSLYMHALDIALV